MKAILLLAAILYAGIINSLYAQNFEPQELVISNTGYSDQYYWVDFNGDGAYDLLEVDFYGGPRLHLAKNGSFVTIGISIDNIYFNEGRCAFNDYDGDGDIDILGSGQNSLVIVKFDEANGFTKVETGITYTDIEYGKLYWLDIDGDLDLDIIHGPKIFLKVESGYAESRFSLPSSVFKIVFSDINNDGLVDIVAGHDYDSYDGSDVHVLINQGEGHFMASGIVLPVPNLKANSIAVIDTDQDGDRDIFAVDRFERGWIFKNSLSESKTILFTEKQIFSNISVTKAFTGDMNSDGLQDLVVHNSAKFTVLENKSVSGVISFESASYALQVENLKSFALVDIDQDNDLDVHVKGYGNPIDNFIFINAGIPGGPGPTSPTNLSTAIDQHISLSWNSVPGLLYNVEVKRNDTIYKTSSTSAVGKLFVPNVESLFATGELSLRGLPEGNYEWRVQTLDPSGRSSAFSSTNSFTVGAAPSSLTLQAIDLRRIKLCWSYNGPTTATFRIFRGSGNETAKEIAQVTAGTNCFEDSTVPANQGVNYFVVAVNGGVNSARSNSVTHYSTQFVEIPFGRSNPNIISGLCLTADYDMDGDYDLGFIGRINFDNNILLKNNGDGGFTPTGAILSGGSFQIPYTEMTGPRDLDNDGDPDLVLITGESYSWQKISVFINNNGTFSKGFETPDYLGIAQLSVEDLNNDGKPDLMFSHNIGNSNGAKQYKLLYQNEQGSFDDSRITFTDKESTSYAYFKLADLNSDGFIDILWSYEENRKMEILVNEGGATFTRRTSSLPLSNLMGVADYNGDGNIDVVVLGNEGLNMYFGRGDFTFPDPKVIPIEYLSSGPTFVNADIDFNGWSDLILTDGYNSQIVLNKGNGSFKSSDILLKKNWGSMISITDLENDGDLDIVKLGNDYQHQGLNYFYKNQISDLNILNESPTPPASLTGKYQAGKSTFIWSASTDDRTPEKLLTYNLSIKDANSKVWLHPETDEAGTFRHRLGPGNAGQKTTKTITNLPAGVYKARVQAMDASFALSTWSPEFQFTIIEGPSALAVERILLNKVKLAWTSSPYEEQIVIIERKSIESQWEVIAELPAGSTSYVDTSLDYNKQFQYRVYEMSGDETTAMSNVAEWSTHMWVLEDTDKPNLFGSLDVVDFSGDGRMDMLLSGGMIYNGYTEDITRATYENKSGTWTRTDIKPSELPHTAKTRFTDLNGDYKPDIFINGYIWNSGYRSEAFQNNGDKTFSPMTNFITNETYSIESYFDFDMDNDLDIHANKSGSYPSITDVYQNQGEGNYSKYATTLCSNCYYQAGVADFDGDGDEDVLSGNSSGYQIYFNTPNGLVPSGASFPGYELIPAVSDYNGDGLPDVIMLSTSFYYGGKIHKNKGVQNGSLTFEVLPIQLLSGDPSLVSADFDHDGMTDIATISPNVTVLLNKGNDAFQTYTVPSFRVSLNNAAIIDYDDDGDLDIYFSGYHMNANTDYGRKGKVLLNQTIVGSKGIFNLPPDAPSGLTSTQDSQGVHLSWNKPGDDHTPANALTYDVVLLRDGKTITKGAHNPDTGKGLRLVSGRVTGIATFNNLLVGPYTWRVQAVDGSFSRSSFAEGSFTFLPSPPVMGDTTIYQCGRTITLTATGTNVSWYKDENLTQLITSGAFHPEESQTVYLTQTVDGYRSVSRRVQITIMDRPPVPGYSMPNPVTICNGSTGAWLLASGTDVKWFSDEALLDLIGTEDYLQVAATEADYFVTQTIGGCQGTPLKIEVNKLKDDFILYYSDGQLMVTEKEADIYYWYRNGFFFHSTTVPFVAITEEPAMYAVSINKGGCWGYSPSVKFPDDVTAAETEIESQWSIFPNPASSQVTLRLMKKPGVTINIIDTQGKSVYSNSFHQETEEVIDTRKWVKGIYLVYVDDGKTLSTRRLVIF